MGQESSSIEQANRLYQMPLSQYGLKQKINSALSLWKHRSPPFEELIEHRVVVNSEEQLENIYEIFRMRHQHLYLSASKYLTCETQGIKGCGGYFKGKIYFESAIANLSMINDIPFNDSLHLFAVSLKGFQLLYQKFGYFQVFEDMIHICENGKLKVWCNSHLYKLGPEPYLLDPYGKQDDMVYRLINLLDENVDRSEMKNLKRQLFLRKSQIKTFQQANALFRRVCRENNWQPPERLKCISDLTKADIDHLLMRQAEHNAFKQFLPSEGLTDTKPRSPRLFNQYDRQVRQDINPFREQDPHEIYERYEQRISPRMNFSPRQRVQNITFSSNQANSQMRRFPSMPDLKPPSLEHTVPFNFTGRQTLARNQDFLENSFGKPSLRANSTVNTQNTNRRMQVVTASLPKEPTMRTSINQQEVNRSLINQVQQHRLIPKYIQSTVPPPVAFPAPVFINKYNPPQISPRNVNIHFTSPQTNQQTLHKTNILRYQQPIRPSNVGDSQRMRQLREPRTSINFVPNELEQKFLIGNYENNLKTLKSVVVSDKFPSGQNTNQEKNEYVPKFEGERSAKSVFHNDSEQCRSEDRISNNEVRYPENVRQRSTPSSQKRIIYNKQRKYSELNNRSFQQMNEVPSNFPTSKEYTDPKLIELLSSRDRSNITISPTFNFMVNNEPVPANDSTLPQNQLYYSFNSKKKDQSQQSDKKLFTTIKNGQMQETVMSSQNYSFTKKKYQAEIDQQIWGDLMKLKKTKNLTSF